MALGTPVSRGAVQSSGSSVSSAAFTPAADSILIAYAGISNGVNNTRTTTIADSLGGTWTEIGSGFSGPDDTNWINGRLWWRDIGASPAEMTVTVTESASSNAVVLMMLEITGADTTDFTNVASDPDDLADPTVVLGSTPEAASTVIGFYHLISSGTTIGTIPTGHSILAEDLAPSGVTDSIQMTYDAGSASDTLGWVSASSSNALAVALEIKEAGGAALSLDAGAGSYTLTGTAASLERGREVAAGAGSYALTGTAASLERGREVVAGAGSYSLSGQTAALEYNREVAAGAGSYALMGTAASLEYGYEVAADAGSYALSGVDAALEFGYEVLAEEGSYSLDGTAAALEYGREISADAGSYELTGQDATLTHNVERVLSADAGSYSLSGAPAGLLWTRVVVGGVGIYVLSGIDATLTLTEVEPPSPEPAPAPSTGGGATGSFRVPGTPVGPYGGLTSARDEKKRDQIADEMREIYRAIVEASEPEIAEQAAEIVSEYTPVKSPDIPPAEIIDWQAIAEEGVSVVAGIRAALMDIQRQMDIERRRIDDEEDLEILLMTVI